MLYNTIIVGGGPAGLTAAIYAARAQLQPLVFEGFMAAGVPAGGQLMFTTYIENFPGFVEPILASTLMHQMREQAIAQGATIKTQTVDRIEVPASGKVTKEFPFRVFVGNEVYETLTLIIATGATAKRLGIPGENKYWNKGISACAVCDGALPIFHNQPVAVVGGGDTACEEALYMTKFASEVYLLVRRDVLRASKVMQQKVLSHEKIKILRNTEAQEAYGDEKQLYEVRIRNNQTGQESILPVRGLFYAIGHQPNSDIVKGIVLLDHDGYIFTTQNVRCSMQDQISEEIKKAFENSSFWTSTSYSGIFAAGDVADKRYRQAITSAGTGCMAALEVEKYIHTLDT